MSAGVAVKRAPSSSVQPAARRGRARRRCRAASCAASRRGAPDRRAGRGRCRIGAAGVAVRRGQRGGDVGAGAEAGIDQASRPQPVERGGVVARPAADWTSGVAVAARSRASARSSIDPADKFGAAAARDRDPRSAAGSAPPPRAPSDGAIGMAEVEPARRRGGEARDDHHGCRTQRLLTANSRIAIHMLSPRLGIRVVTREDGPRALSALRATGPGDGVRATEHWRLARRMYHPDLIRHPDGCPALVLNADYTPLSYYPLSACGRGRPRSRRCSSSGSMSSPITTAKCTARAGR